MKFTKKGDLAISTNAIVVLIIAVIMLGLIIGFVTKGFDSVGNKFFGEVEKLPDPQTPSASTPITTSELTIVKQGDDFGMKIAVYSEAGATTTAPSVSCGTAGVVASGTANAKTIAARSSDTFIYVGKIGDAAPVGKNLCAITFGTLSKDIIIEVTK